MYKIIPEMTQSNPIWHLFVSWNINVFILLRGRNPYLMQEWSVIRSFMTIHFIKMINDMWKQL